MLGGGYLTLKDGGNIVYSALDTNGDIDCKIKKNDNVFKLGKVPIKPGSIRVYDGSQITIPSGVNVISVFIDCYNTIGQRLYKNAKNIKVTQNKTYAIKYIFKIYPNFSYNQYEMLTIGNFNFVSGVDYGAKYGCEDLTVFSVIEVNWSEAINNTTWINGSAD
jgi:hypothetical protein